MKKQKIKRRQKIARIILYIIVEIAFINLLIYILDNCITVYR